MGHFYFNLWLELKKILKLFTKIFEFLNQCFEQLRCWKKCLEFTKPTCWVNSCFAGDTFCAKYWFKHFSSLETSNEFVPQIELHQNSCQHPLINYIVVEDLKCGLWCSFSLAIKTSIVLKARCQMNYLLLLWRRM